MNDDQPIDLRWSPSADNESEASKTLNEPDLRSAPLDLPLGKKQIIWPAVLDYPAFSKTPCPKPKPLILNLLDCGSRILFGGGSKTYKTWLQCDLAICLACGAPWLGFETIPTRVLYVNFELKDYYMQYRLRQIREAKEIDDSLSNLRIWNLRGHDFDRSEFTSELLKLCQADSFQMVFIDPFYKLLRANEDENKQTDMNAVLSCFNPINKANVTVAFGIHFSKGNQAAKEPSDRISGAGTLVRDPDDIVTLTRHEEDGAFTLDFLIRDHPPIEPFVIQWKAPIMVRTDLDPTNIKVSRPRNSGANSNDRPESLLQFIPPDGELFGAVLSKAKRALHKGNDTILGWVSELESAGKIFRSNVTAPGHKGRKPVRLFQKTCSTDSIPKTNASPQPVAS